MATANILENLLEVLLNLGAATAAGSSRRGRGAPRSVLQQMGAGLAGGVGTGFVDPLLSMVNPRRGKIPFQPPLPSGQQGPQERRWLSPEEMAGMQLEQEARKQEADALYQQMLREKMQRESEWDIFARPFKERQLGIETKTMEDLAPMQVESEGLDLRGKREGFGPPSPGAQSILEAVAKMVGTPAPEAGSQSEALDLLDPLFRLGALRASQQPGSGKPTSPGDIQARGNELGSQLDSVLRDALRTFLATDPRAKDISFFMPGEERSKLLGLEGGPGIVDSLFTSIAAPHLEDYAGTWKDAYSVEDLEKILNIGLGNYEFTSPSGPERWLGAHEAFDVGGAGNVLFPRVSLTSPRRSSPRAPQAPVDSSAVKKGLATVKPSLTPEEVFEIQRRRKGR